MTISLDESSGAAPLQSSSITTIEQNQFTLNIKCHWCGHKGSSLWERTTAGRQLISLNGFYERLAKKQPYNIEMVCDNCDRSQPE